MTRSRRPKNSFNRFNGDEEDSQSPYESNYEDDDSSISNSATNSNSPTIDHQLSFNYSKTPSLIPQTYPPTIPYINVAPLPIFHGNPDECPVSHLSRFVKVCRANNASSTDSMTRIFPVTLESEAGIWYDLNIEPYPSLTWDEIKASFLEAYNKTESIEELRSDLLMLSQRIEEPVRSYFLRMQMILKRWPDHGFTDDILKGIFMGGLMEDFREWIIMQKPVSLNEALSLAFSFEKIKRIKGVKLMEGVKCGFCGGLHEEKFCKVKERMRELLRKKKQIVKVSSEEEKGINGESKNDEEDEDEKNEEKGAVRRCHCSKHQRWKKKLERNISLLSRNSTADLNS